MITRKDFLARAGAAALAAPITAQGASIGVGGRARGLLGGAFMGCMMAQGAKMSYTARDYIQDGLVVHLDAKESGGYGVHHATRLYNLKDSTQYASWYRDSAGYLTDDTLWGSFYSTGANKITKPLGRDCTIQLVFVGGIRAMPLLKFGTAYVFSIQGYNATNFRVWLGDTSHPSANIPTPAAACVMTFVLNADRVYAYANDVLKLNGTQMVYDGFEATYSDPYPMWAGAPADIPQYCFRAYNRALTPAEIAHNYAVDKARFGLPDPN